MGQPFKILIVDDEPNMLHMLSVLLSEDGFVCACAKNAKEALAVVAEQRFDFILSDVRMPGMDGLKLLETLKSLGVDSLVILMSAYGSMDLVLEAIRKGAYDYISKPFKTDEVALTFRKAAERERLRREVVRLSSVLKRFSGESRFVVKSPPMKLLMNVAQQAAKSDAPILITGESGVGKEVLAHEIHRMSARGDCPLVPINCGAIPQNLLESELFGFKKGAFTSATESKLGLLEEAEGGAVFLDEIATMSPALQAKLLRTLDSGEFRRLGETTLRHVNVRIIAATNEDVEAAIQKGLFRSDLYYRLAVFQLVVPPLRERREDIPALLSHFVQMYNSKLKRRVTGISNKAQEALFAHPWKGNVRELGNVIERAMILTEGQTIELEALSLKIAPGADHAKIDPVFPTLSLKSAYRQVERELISRALDETRGNRSQAALLLEISYPSLLQKIKELGVQVGANTHT